MQLDERTCWTLLATEHHGVLGTVHATRGVDAVPVVFAVLPDQRIVTPIDAVKPKRTDNLQRLRNIETDERCVLLVDHYDDDWSQLWWVRVHARARRSSVTPEVASALAARFAAYGAEGSVTAVLVLEPSGVTGWSASR